jgi:hypothetical protein
MKVYLIMQYVEDEEVPFQLGGITNSAELADKGCLTKNCCYCEVELNEIFPVEGVDSLTWIYPRRGQKIVPGSYKLERI